MPAFILVALVFLVIAFAVQPTAGTDEVAEAAPLQQGGQVQHVDYSSDRVAYEVWEPYTEQECHLVPYTDRECTYEDLQYTKEHECYPSGWNQSWMVSECTIKNSDTVGGNFIIYSGVDISSKNDPPKGKWYKNKDVGINETAYLSPGSSKTVRFSQEVKLSWNTEISSCYCYANSITKKQTCREVERTRNECSEVTKYRKVTRYGPAE